MRKKIFTFLLALVTSVGMSWATTTDLASITGDYTAQDGEILTGTLGVNVKISIADGATVTLLNANINGDKTWTTGDYAGLTCLGDATITIVGKNSVSGFSVDNGYPGIYVPSGKTLIINGTGSLTAQSSTEEAAGIGARKNTHCGNIEIQSGKITAIAGGEEGAGIGGGFNGNCGNITISGGIVTAVGGYRGAGIGGGRRSGSTDAGHCGNILISGGVVSATSGEQAAAIGGGRGNNSAYKSNCGTITITTALKVYADQGGSSTNTIGAGKYGNCGTVTIGDNTGVINNDPYTYRTKEDGEIVVVYINAIGTVVYTQECKDKIDIARELYDALEDSQKDLVTNYQTLLDAEAAYAALIPQPVTTHTLQLHVNDALMGSVALQNPSNDIVDNGDGTYTVPEGAEVTLLATPNEGYEFTGWKASNTICDFTECEFVALPTVDNPLTFDMNVEVAFIAEFAAVTPTPATTTVTWDISTLSSIGVLQNGESFTKDGVTLTAPLGIVEQSNGYWSGPSDEDALKFSTSLGNFTKIEITADIIVLGGSGWTQTSPGAVWTGDANETTFGGYLLDVSQVVFTLAPAPSSDVDITPNVDPENPTVYYSTFFDSENKYALPAGVEAYVASVSSDALNLTKIAGEGQTIPADNAVILRSSVAGYTLTVSDAAPVTFTATNSLRGVDAETTVTDIAGLTADNCYVLSGGSEDETVTGVGFYRIFGSTLLAHKAYVQYNATSGAPKRMRFVFPQEQMPTGIDETNTADKAQKVMENGTLYIIRDGVRYNATGQIAQ